MEDFSSMHAQRFSKSLQSPVMLYFSCLLLPISPLIPLWAQWCISLLATFLQHGALLCDCMYLSVHQNFYSSLILIVPLWAIPVAAKQAECAFHCVVHVCPRGSLSWGDLKSLLVKFFMDWSCVANCLWMSLCGRVCMTGKQRGLKQDSEHMWPQFNGRIYGKLLQYHLSYTVNVFSGLQSRLCEHTQFININTVKRKSHTWPNNENTFDTSCTVWSLCIF